MNGLCYTADKVMQLKQRLNGVLTVLERRFNNSSIIREADLFSKR